MCDLADPKALEDRVDELLLHHNALLRGLDAPQVKRKELLASLREVAPKVLPFADAAWRILDDARRAGRRILFEGAQAAMLDVDHGTYPYVTSSNTLAGQAAAGSGSRRRRSALCSASSKPTRRGSASGPFPTELTDEIGQWLGERGREFGTVTGRRRRCGWFDAVMVRQAIKIGGIDGIALTKLDVLDGFETSRSAPATAAATALDYLPRRPHRAGRDRADLRGLRGLARKHARRALLCRSAGQRDEVHPAGRRADRRAGAMLSTSPEREDTVLVRDPFAD